MKLCKMTAAASASTARLSEFCAPSCRFDRREPFVGEDNWNTERCRQTIGLRRHPARRRPFAAIERQRKADDDERRAEGADDLGNRRVVFSLITGAPKDGSWRRHGPTRVGRRHSDPHIPEIEPDDGPGNCQFGRTTVGFHVTVDRAYVPPSDEESSTSADSIAATSR